MTQRLVPTTVPTVVSCQASGCALCASKSDLLKLGCTLLGANPTGTLEKTTGTSFRWLLLQRYDKLSLKIGRTQINTEQSPTEFDESARRRMVIARGARLRCYMHTVAHVRSATGRMGEWAGA